MACELHKETDGTGSAKEPLMVRKMKVEPEFGGDSESPAATRLKFGAGRGAASKTS
jgi:hypothetical protein